MSATPVIAIFDIGKTNKKLFLFDEDYRVVFDRSECLAETVDEDGYPCENLESLKTFIFDSLNKIFSLKEFRIKAVNFSAYGASLVYIGKDGNPLKPLYNYLKPYPGALSDQLYAKYGGEEKFSLETASPVLGSLNSGLQLYRLKQERPAIFNSTKFALHLPQYLSFLLTGKCYSDLTSIGCHTALWDFEENGYHEWVRNEGLDKKLAPIMPSNTVLPAAFLQNNFKVGTGLHDSSAALIPYLMNFPEPFVLISTGTWNISLNPFNQIPLSAGELKEDCLCYLQYEGKPVKASRLFSGFEHEEQVKRIAAHFNQEVKKFGDVAFDPAIIENLKDRSQNTGSFTKVSAFGKRDLSNFKNDIEAYHQLMLDLVQMQVISTRLVLKDTRVKKIFVDGGFSKNRVFMHLLAAAFQGMEVYTADTAQATAVGAALSTHGEWNVNLFKIILFN